MDPEHLLYIYKIMYNIIYYIIDNCLFILRSVSTTLYKKVVTSSPNKHFHLSISFVFILMNPVIWLSSEYNIQSCSHFLHSSRHHKTKTKEHKHFAATVSVGVAALRLVEQTQSRSQTQSLVRDTD